MESLNGRNRVVYFHKDGPAIGRAQRYDLILCSGDAGTHGAQGGAVAHILAPETDGQKCKGTRTWLPTASPGSLACELDAPIRLLSIYYKGVRFYVTHSFNAQSLWPS
jgi:hypothetical protein